MKNKVKELREAMGLTQEDLGQLAGVSRQAIHAVENEKYEPSIWLAYDLSKIFKCSIEEVFMFLESKRKTRAQLSRGISTWH